MDIPQELKEAIENITSDIKNIQLVEEAQKISRKYRENSGKGEKIVTQKEEAIAYAISRMPATYCAIYSVLKNLLENYNEKIESVLDVGAGTGAATCAIANLVDANKYICLEREKEMRNVGQKLMKNCEGLQTVQWKEFDLCKDDLNDEADLVVSSYVINELTEKNRKEAIMKMWKSTNKILLIVEPGTPEGFKHILEAREMLIDKGANILAPCAHQNKCDLPSNDWCSFYVRVARSGAHRQAKKGELGYEDEKFSYIVFSKQPTTIKCERILRHPQINSGYVKVKLCTLNGIEEKVFSKKDRETYKKVRKLSAGDKIND